MSETTLIVMVKNPETNLLEREYDSFVIEGAEELVVHLFAIEESGGASARMRLSAPDVQDWQYDAVFDYYDEGVFAGLPSVSVSEADGLSAPAWDFVFPLPAQNAAAEEKIQKIINLHAAELASVFEAIKDKREEYL